MSGVDSLRFLLAVWVLINHLGAPPLFREAPGESFVHAVVRAMFENCFNGPAAVAIFFVISGFCIHFPFRAGRSIPRVAQFYARRNVRIVLPAVVASVVSPLVGVKLVDLSGSILWSLVCEEIYYLLYPWLRVVATRWDWKRLLVVSGTVSLAPLVVFPEADYMPSFGFGLTWVIGLPYWIAGALLAERWDRLQMKRVRLVQVWTLRLVMVGLASLSSIAAFHSPVGFPWTLPAVALVGYFWVGAEARLASERGGRWLDCFGSFSYSIYLFHPFAVAMIGGWTGWLAGTWTGWSGMMIGTLSVCFVAYLLVESPAHRLARSISRVARSGSDDLRAAAVEVKG